MHGSPLARILFGVYVVLAAYATLYPLEGWRSHGLSPLAYLDAGWPRYVTAFDVVANVLGYVPFGFLCVAALHPALRGTAAVAAALASAALLSLALEGAQSYLPMRVATHLDVVCNLAGAGAGALLALVASRATPAGPLHRLREAFHPGAGIDVGLVLLALWLFTQLNPATLLFAAGDLRNLLVPDEGPAREPAFFAGIEAATAAANLAAVGLLLSVLARGPSRLAFVALVGVALAVKTAAFSIVMQAQDVLAWLTPGAQIGLVLGLAAGLAGMALPRTARLAVAAVLVMAATVLVNVAPANPYLAASLKVWAQGHFLNFNGLTRLVSALWAFFAAGYLIYLSARGRVG